MIGSPDDACASTFACRLASMLLAAKCGNVNTGHVGKQSRAGSEETHVGGVLYVNL